MMRVTEWPLTFLSCKEILTLCVNFSVSLDGVPYDLLAGLCQGGCDRYHLMMNNGLAFRHFEFVFVPYCWKLCEEEMNLERV